MKDCYRENGERDGDRIVYFDYAKALENQRRPIPWRNVIGLALRWLAGVTLAAAISYVATGTITEHTFVFVAASALPFGIIPLLRSNRMLSGDNFVETRRRPK